MKKIILVFVFITLATKLYAQAPTPAANRAAEAEPPAAAAPASDIATQQPAATAAAALPSPTEFIESAAEKIKGIKSYSVKFSLIQSLQPNNKLTEDKKEALRNEFRLLYTEDEKDSESWLMRLEALRGQHQKTVVVHKKDKSGKNKYFVYKPAGVVVLTQDDPRVADIPYADIHQFISGIQDSISRKGSSGGEKTDSEVKFEYLQATNMYVLQVSDFYKRFVSYFDGGTLMLVRQDMFQKKGKEFGFKQSIEWRDFQPGPQNPAEITAVPDLK